MIHGETPYIVRGVESDYKRLFFSSPEKALMRSVTLQSGYGILPAGTILAKNASAAGNVNKYLPYSMTVPSSADPNQKARAFLVADSTNSVYVYVTLQDSYKFKVGDDVIIGDADTTTTSTENLGAITVIDRTTYVHMAKITVTTAVSGTGFTVAQSAYIQVEAGATSANNYSEAVGILAASVDTGTGENAQGAVAPMIISNAILYKAALVNYDAAALADFTGATVDGIYFILK